MESIYNELTSLLQQWGVQTGNMGTVVRGVMIAGILLIAWLVDFFCRKVIIASIRKVTAKTHNKWDDYLFNDKVLNNLCHLIPPIVVYALIPFAFQDQPTLLSFIMKLCWVYITIVSVRLI